MAASRVLRQGKAIMMKFCPLCSGSSGNCSLLSAGDANILVDAGVTAKRITELLALVDVEMANIDAIVVTHEHSDHIKGVGVLARKYHIPVYANADCWAQMKRCDPNIPQPSVRVFESDHPFYFKGVRIFPFSTPHDSVHSVGYTFEYDGKKCAVMTDVGHVDARLIGILEKSDLLLLEANHDVDMLNAGSYPYSLKKRILSARGHLCNEDAGLTLVRLHDKGVRNVILGHLSQENNTKELALVTVQTVLEDAGCLDDMHIIAAERDYPCGVFDLGA